MAVSKNIRIAFFFNVISEIKQFLTYNHPSNGSKHNKVLSSVKSTFSLKNIHSYIVLECQFKITKLKLIKIVRKERLIE